jgi:hypothetical protein
MGEREAWGPNELPELWVGVMVGWWSDSSWGWLWVIVGEYGVMGLE